MRAHVPKSEWFRCFRPREWAGTTLLCFPHAGGTAAAYRDWAAELPQRYELFAVQYPGRADRLKAPLIDAMDPLADAIAAEVPLLPRRPTILFGHSMGASVAYEVARRLEAGGRDVRHLYVSGRPAPTAQRPGTVHLRGDEGLLADVVRLGGTSADLLANAELQRLVLPALRADYRLIETYLPTPAGLLTCPVTAVIGDEDTEVREDEAAAWAEVTSGPFRLRTLPGDHFYLVPQRTRLLEELAGPRPASTAAPATQWPSTP
ncbi:alpha/beta fold hydrolase [Streptomyces sp. NPDC050211]|uniref:thioesterase II family protein n=1 Tax=Streptomyces sp. NPDC050211 TaxID=3154932 RepID=UPI00341F96ED